ncbi:MAG: hypothetical protein JNL61_21385 [Rhizobiaceae bacterium]|nr:hypothetical protein [Rhizobiaceae bacterium]
MAEKGKSGRKAPTKADTATRSRKTAAEAKGTKNPSSGKFGQRASVPKAASQTNLTASTAKAKPQASKARRVAVAVGETAVGAIAAAASLVKRAARGKKSAPQGD